MMIAYVIIEILGTQEIKKKRKKEIRPVIFTETNQSDPRAGIHDDSTPDADDNNANRCHAWFIKLYLSNCNTDTYNETIDL